MDRTRIERISQMESYLDEAGEAVKALSDAIERYGSVREKYHKLLDYYDSDLWMQDLEADEAGLLPADLKRGVLSEDAVYDLITEHEYLMERLEGILHGEETY